MPVVAMLNIVGLAVAISVAYMIFVQVRYEVGFNKGIKDADKCALIVGDGNIINKRRLITNMARAAVELVKNIPMVEQVGSINLLGDRRGACTEDNPDGFVLTMSNLLYHSTTLDMFGFDIVEGDTASLNIYGNVAVSESAAEKYNLKIGSRFAHNYNEDIPEFGSSLYYGIVTAIYKDFPEDCDLGSLEAVGNYDSNDLNDWSNWNYHVYVKLRDGYSFAEFDSLLTATYSKEMARVGRNDKTKFFTIPVSKLYYSIPEELDYGIPSSRGDVSTTISLAAIAVVMLLVAFVNFLNFVMSLIPLRVRGVNTRRILGASVLSLKVDFITESLLFLLLSLLVALLIIAAVDKSELSSVFMSSVNVMKHADVLLAIVAAAVVLAVAVALYPAFYLTSFSPAFALNGNFGRNGKGVALRTLLICVQFFASFVLIVTALFVWLQNRYLMSADMGFNREQLLTVTLPRLQFSLHGQTPRDELSDRLKAGGYVKDVAFSNGEFIANRRWTVGRSVNGPLPEGVGNDITFSPFHVSWNFLQVMGVDVVDGRDFSLDDVMSGNGALIFTETSKMQYGLSTDNSVAPRGNDVPIVGFCRNVNARSLHETTGAFAFYCMGQDEIGNSKRKYYAMSNLYIRLVAGADVDEAVEQIRNTIVDYFPGISPEAFDIEFFDDVLRRQYEKEQRISLMVGIFAFVVIAVSLMGLFATVLFEVKYMEREIALRRINGAMVTDILLMINFKYVKQLFIGYLFALPLSYMLVSGWLQSFAYRTELHPAVFLFAFVVVLVVALSVVTFTSWRVVNTNPVEVLGKGE